MIAIRCLRSDLCTAVIEAGSSPYSRAEVWCVWMICSRLTALRLPADEDGDGDQLPPGDDDDDDDDDELDLGDDDDDDMEDSFGDDDDDEEGELSSHEE